MGSTKLNFLQKVKAFNSYRVTDIHTYRHDQNNTTMLRRWSTSTDLMVWDWADKSRQWRHQLWTRGRRWSSLNEEQHRRETSHCCSSTATLRRQGVLPCWICTHLHIQTDL